MLPRKIQGLLFLSALLVCATTPAIGGSHTWQIVEIFSNASGTVQFIEMKECCGGENEAFTRNETLSSLGNVFTIPSNLVPPTSFKRLLFGTAAYDALPNSPTPDFVIPANFFSVTGDTISYSVYDSKTFGSGVLPTDGVQSLNQNLSPVPNSPTNYAGQSGSINATQPQPPGVPDGANGTTPMTVTPLDATGTTLSIAWDTTCTSTGNNHIVYGQASGLPSAPGMAFTPLGGVCAIGTTSPYVWNNVPGASDGTGVLWWIIVAKAGGIYEGSWGKDSAGAERLGPGADGTSGLCSVTTRSLSNTCGH